MFLPALVYYLVFCYYPMYGAKMAFYEYDLFGEPVQFVGMKNFTRFFQSRDFGRILGNTLIISFSNLLIGIFVSVVFSLLLNEIRSSRFKKIVQTAVFLPYFFSWVVVASIFTMLLSPETGLICQVVEMLGGTPTQYLIHTTYWRPIFIAINRWKDTGWSAIIYIAALTSIDPQLYDAAKVDGAGRIAQMMHISIPGILGTILTVFILDSAKCLDIYQPILVMQNSLVYAVSEVIGTYTYRVGLQQGDYSYATAIGLFRSVISLVLVLATNGMSRKIRQENIL